MAKIKYLNRKRPDPVRVMLAAEEKQVLQDAADDTGMALSVYIRVAALKEARTRVEART